MSKILKITGLKKFFANEVVLRDLDIEIDKGEIACILGSSGCGKSTLLRCIAGFESIHSGQIEIAGKVVSSPSKLLAPEKRNIGIVFQDYALFPHLSCFQNISFGLHQLNKQEQQKIAIQYLELVGLGEYANKYPHELSGGQRQRLAIARALAPGPQLLLLDEPFSNLDTDLRCRLNHEIHDILKECGATAIMVTHNQEEAFDMADSIGVLNEGRICQWDTAYNIYHQPKERFIANFIGLGRFVKLQATGKSSVRLANIEIVGHCNRILKPGEIVDVLLRPDDVIHDDNSPIKAKVINKSFRGPYMLYELELEQHRFLSYVPSHHNHAIGENIGIYLEIDHIVAF